MDHFEGEATRLGIKASYVKQGLQSLQQRTNTLQTLLLHKKLPKQGLDDTVIEFIAAELAVMDSNNFPSNTGVGEREGRVFSRLVARRHYNFAHGIGRSGDITEVQPKAAGSSILYKLTMHMTAHAMQVSGFSTALTQRTPPPLVLPLATGMSLTMCMLTLKKNRPAADYVIWPRIDQKSCFKSILTAGLKPLIVDNIFSPEDGSLQTNLEAIKGLLESHGDAILCVLSTTSCFAPRQPDLVDEIAVLCKTFHVGHVINNAYGVQCPVIVKSINRAVTIGHVDAIVQSTDKNFMVPVGGAIVMSAAPSFLTDLSSIYPGRASMAPILDLFITLLSMGEDGYKMLLERRARMFDILKGQLGAFAASHGETIVSSPRNTISIAVSMNMIHGLEKSKFPVGGATAAAETAVAALATDVESSAVEKANGPPPQPLATDKNLCTFFGSMLFQRCVSGCRVVSLSIKTTKINSYEFAGWGSHISRYPCSYFTAACAIGLSESEIDVFMERLRKVYQKVAPKGA